MSVDPVFYGRVLDGGLLCLDRPKDYARFVRSFAGKYVEITIRRQRTKRSNQANRWLWGVALEMLVEHFGYEKHERKEAKEYLHYKYVSLCFGTHRDARIGEDVPNVRSSKLSTAEFSDYMEWFVRHAAQEEGVLIPLPNEVDLSKVEDWEAA